MLLAIGHRARAWPSRFVGGAGGRGSVRARARRERLSGQCPFVDRSRRSCGAGGRRAGWWRWPGWRRVSPGADVRLPAGRLGARCRAAGARWRRLVLPRARRGTALDRSARPGAGAVRADGGAPGQHPGRGRVPAPAAPRGGPRAVRAARHAVRPGARSWRSCRARCTSRWRDASCRRLLYGARWVAADAADPAYRRGHWPGLGLGAWGVGASLLLASNRLRLCTALEALSSLLALPAVAVAWAGHGIVAYAWVAAAGQLVGAAAALAAASPLMAPGWARGIGAPFPLR